jgi:hypothetical protein
MATREEFWQQVFFAAYCETQCGVQASAEQADEALSEFDERFFVACEAASEKPPADIKYGVPESWLLGSGDPRQKHWTEELVSEGTAPEPPGESQK